MARHEVAKVEDVQPGEHHVVTIGRVEIGLFNIDGEYHALPNVCPHQYGPLCEDGALAEGTIVATEETGYKPRWDLQGEVVSCPWHQLQYHVPSGRCLSFSDMNLTTYDVVVEDGRIFIES